MRCGPGAASTSFPRRTVSRTRRFPIASGSALVQELQVRGGNRSISAESESVALDDRLQQLCSRMLTTLRAEDERHATPGSAASLTTTLRNELADIVQSGLREMAAKLRGELSHWRAAAQHIQHAARGRYLRFPEHLVGLASEFARTQQQAERVAEALAALAEDRLVPIVGASGCLSLPSEDSQPPVCRLIGWVESSSPTAADLLSSQATLQAARDDAPPRRRPLNESKQHDEAPTRESPKQT